MIVITMTPATTPPITALTFMALYEPTFTPEVTNCLHELSNTIGIGLVIAFFEAQAESEYKVNESDLVMLLGLSVLHIPLFLSHGAHALAVVDQYIQFDWQAASLHTAIFMSWACAWIRPNSRNRVNIYFYWIFILAYSIHILYFILYKHLVEWSACVALSTLLVLMNYLTVF